MALIANRKSVMTLFSTDNDIHCHRVRIVLAEKGINFEVVNVNPSNPPEDLIELNPYGGVPVLVDRELVLYDAQVIMEYLDERFPHPPLMPVDPVSRGRTRMTLRRIQHDWDVLVDKITAGTDVAQSAKELKEKYGLTNMQLAFTTSVQESTISRILNKKHKTQRAILFVLNLALEEYKEYYEVKEMQ